MFRKKILGPKIFKKNGLGIYFFLGKMVGNDSKPVPMPLFWKNRNRNRTISNFSTTFWGLVLVKSVCPGSVGLFAKKKINI